MKKTVIFFYTAVFFFFFCGSTGNTDSIIRDFPTPFSAMLAICSDIDGSTSAEFETYHKFLNTKEMTEWGQGLGLDVGDSYWMYMGSDIDTVIDWLDHDQNSAMTYFKLSGETTKDTQKIIDYYKKGWIDSIHSFGDFSRAEGEKTSFTRELAEKSIQEMKEAGIVPSIWINHGSNTNVQNIRGNRLKPSLSYQKGADPSSDYYHADITIPAGIKYIWFSEPDGRFGLKSPLYAVTLEDGQKVWGFTRYTGKSGLRSHEYYWSVFSLHKQLTKENLDRLVTEKKFAVVAQHLGGSVYYKPIPYEGMDALRLLASYQDRGEILITRTSRLLEYVRVKDHLGFIMDTNGNINITGIYDPVLGYDLDITPEKIRGITFYTDHPENIIISINGEKVKEKFLLRTPKTGEEQGTVGIHWYED